MTTETHNASPDPSGSDNCAICGAAIRYSEPRDFENRWQHIPQRSYVAGWNMPGYIPETDPETFDTLAEAVAYLREQAERWADEDDTDAPTFEIGADYADAWYKSETTPSGLHLWAVLA